MNIDEELNVADELSANETPVVETPVKETSLREELQKVWEQSTKDEATPDKPRDASGKFAAKTEEQAPVDKPVQAQETTQPVVETPAVKPPVSWSAEAKADFEKLPPHVQAAVAKREAEVDNGFKVLQDYKGLEEFMPVIKQANTTPAEVVKRAVNWEKSLLTDPINTLKYAAKMAGVDLRQLVTDQPAQNTQPQPQQPQFDPRMVSQIVQRELQQNEALRTAEAFVKDPAKPYAGQVIDEMAILISNGRAKNLDEAYDMAIWANPTTRAELIKQQTASVEQTAEKQRIAQAADQARRASKSISGSSSAGSSRAPNAPELTLREELARNMKLASGGV